MKNFYLIDSPKINELNQVEKDILDKQLTIYHTHSSSVIEKADAIYTLVKNYNLEKLWFEYNTWLYDFVNYHLKTISSEKEKQSLKKILGCCYHIFGLISHLEGSSTNALYNYQEAIKILKKLDDKSNLCKSYYNTALIYHEKGDLYNAIKLHEICIEIGREIGDKTILAPVYNSLSAIYFYSEKFIKSLNYRFKALSLYEEINDEKGIALCYKNIGSLLMQQLDFDEALKYFFAALKLSKKIGDKTRQALSYVRIGSIYQEKGKNDTALRYYMKAENLATIFDLPLYAYLKIGTVYESQNQISVAMDYYKKSLQLSERIESKELLSATLSKIGPLEIKMGNVEKATLQIKRAFKLSQELGDLELIQDAAIAKVLLAIAIEDYKLAYEMEKLRNETQQKILNKENFKEVIKHQLKYEYEKQLEKKDIEIEEEKQNNQHLQEQINILSAKNKLLTSKNKIINEQLAAKDLLMQKLPENNNGIYNSA